MSSDKVPILPAMNKYTNFEEAKEYIKKLEEERIKLLAEVKKNRREWGDTWDLLHTEKKEKKSLLEITKRMAVTLNTRIGIEESIAEWDKFRSENTWV